MMLSLPSVYFSLRKQMKAHEFWNPQFLLLLLLPSRWPFARGRSLRIIICKRPAPHFDNQKRAWKIHFLDPSQWDKMCFKYQRIKLVWKNGSIFSYFLTVRAEGAVPPLPLGCYSKSQRKDGRRLRKENRDRRKWKKLVLWHLGKYRKLYIVQVNWILVEQMRSTLYFDQ